jgi:hypothetical protein
LAQYSAKALGAARHRPPAMPAHALRASPLNVLQLIWSDLRLIGSGGPKVSCTPVLHTGFLTFEKFPLRLVAVGGGSDG